MVLLEFSEAITSLQDEDHSMDIIFLDFSKAFDKVPKNRLLEKLKAHLYINLAWVSVCLFVYPINVKTAEPIRTKFCVGSRDPREDF